MDRYIAHSGLADHWAKNAHQCRPADSEESTYNQFSENLYGVRADAAAHAKGISSIQQIYLTVGKTETMERTVVGKVTTPSRR